jgi:hypothetical protein
MAKLKKEKNSIFEKYLHKIYNNGFLKKICTVYIHIYIFFLVCYLKKVKELRKGKKEPKIFERD